MTNKLGHNWILLRGLTRESAHWGDFVPLLQSAFPAAKITAPDLPGAGGNYRDASPSTVRAIADKVRADAQGSIQQPVTILALSLGAMVAWEWMLTYPDDICGVALINCSFAGLSPFYHRLRWQSYGKLAALMIKRDMRDRESAILELLSNRRDHYQQIAEEWGNIQKERPVSLKNTFRQLMAAASYHPGEMKPSQPVLLLNSQGDQLVAPICSEKIHQKFNLELCTHPWAGHDLTVDDGAWVVSKVKDWAVKIEGG